MVISDILSHIMSSTWNTGIFSDKLKYAQTKPIWEKVKNKPWEISAYISATCFLGGLWKGCTW